jgi:hypothetical protein
MAGAWTTKTIKDAAGANITMRVWDESGAGTGPFSFGQVLTNGDGTTAPPGFASVPTTAQPMSVGFQLVGLPTDQPTQAVAQDTSRLLNGASGTSLTPKWATIAVSASGSNQIVAAVTSKKIRVIHWDLTPNAAVNAKWQSAANDKTGLYYMANQGNGHARGFNPVGWFETNAGEALNLNLSGAVAVGGVVGYVEV